MPNRSSQRRLQAVELPLVVGARLGAPEGRPRSAGSRHLGVPRNLGTLYLPPARVATPGSCLCDMRRQRWRPSIAFARIPTNLRANAKPPSSACEHAHPIACAESRAIGLPFHWKATGRSCFRVRLLGVASNPVSVLSSTCLRTLRFQLDHVSARSCIGRPRRASSFGQSSSSTAPLTSDSGTLLLKQRTRAGRPLPT